jgi:hypothetical protein
MICCISGLETENKYANQPMHPEVIRLAKDYMADQGCSMTDALKFISYILINDIRTKLQNGEVPHGTEVTKSDATRVKRTRRKKEIS